jgi:hypothetical protein
VTRSLREGIERGCIANQPDVTEGIAEPSLAMDAPRHLMVANRATGAIGSCCERPRYEGVGIIDEDLDAHGRRPDGGRALEPGAGRLMQEEGRPLDLQADDGTEAPQLGRASALVYQSAATGASSTASMSEMRVVTGS